MAAPSPRARITAASPKPSVCILERGREWEVGKFPDEIGEVVRNARNPTFNPTGLYDFLLFPDISVMKGCGLGGTSLVNANVAIVPDEEVFQQIAWPKAVKRPELMPFYEKAGFDARRQSASARRPVEVRLAAQGQGAPQARAGDRRRSLPARHRRQLQGRVEQRTASSRRPASIAAIA